MRKWIIAIVTVILVIALGVAIGFFILYQELNLISNNFYSLNF